MFRNGRARLNLSLAQKRDGERMSSFGGCRDNGSHFVVAVSGGGSGSKSLSLLDEKMLETHRYSPTTSFGIH